MSSPLTPVLGAIPPLLASDPAIESVLGKRAAVLAVPEPARAAAIATLVDTTDRRPIVVAVPTTANGRRPTQNAAARCAAATRAVARPSCCSSRRIGSSLIAQMSQSGVT